MTDIVKKYIKILLVFVGTILFFGFGGLMIFFSINFDSYSRIRNEGESVQILISSSDFIEIPVGSDSKYVIDALISFDNSTQKAWIRFPQSVWNIGSKKKLEEQISKLDDIENGILYGNEKMNWNGEQRQRAYFEIDKQLTDDLITWIVVSTILTFLGIVSCFLVCIL